ncbi:MAG: site-specific integrase [Turicibacter sp.]|nr:site-specific integrase [Turicibacter sp.]
MRKARNIYKRKDGRFEGRYIKAHEGGKPIYASIYGKTYAAVKDKLEKRQLSPKFHKNTRIITKIEEYLGQIQVKTSTQGIYRGYLDNHIAPFFKKMRCNQLNRDVIQNFVNCKNGLASTTAQSVFYLLKRALSGCPPDIFNVPLPKIVKPKIPVLSREEQKRLEQTATARADRIVLTLCLYTGLRIGELCGLKWDDCDFENKQLDIRRTVLRIKNPEKGGTKTIISIQEPKSRSSRRTIPLPDFIVQLLQMHKNASNSPFIVSTTEKPLEPRTLQYRFKRMLQKANLRKVKFHVTRHTFAVRALEIGFDIKTLSEILGHSSPMITLENYAHILDEHKRQSMEKLAIFYG